MTQPSQPSLRPENRRRSPERELLWADTLPQCYRSEAFAEDLPVAEPALQAVAAPRQAWRARFVLPTAGPRWPGLMAVGSA